MILPWLALVAAVYDFALVCLACGDVGDCHRQGMQLFVVELPVLWYTRASVKTLVYCFALVCLARGNVGDCHGQGMQLFVVELPVL